MALGRAAMLCAALTLISAAADGGARGRNQAPGTSSTASPQQAPPPPMPFSEWLEGVRTDALARGIKAETVQRPSRVWNRCPSSSSAIARRRSSRSRSTRTWRAGCRRRFVRDTRRAFAKHKALLGKVGSKYGVGREMLAAVWSIESNLGRFSGVRPTIQALATLAWDGRRAGVLPR